jgi:hypothetical protein
MHCPPGNSVPAELAVTIQDGTAFVIASHHPTRAAAAEPADRAGRENTAATRITRLKRSARLNAWTLGYGDGPGGGWRTAPGTLISSEVIVWQIVALRVNVPGWSAHADGGSGVVAGVAETPWTGSATRDAVRHRDAASGADAGLDGRGESP